jgi:hypothetical protein
MGALYRMRQGVRALLAWVRPVDDALAAQYLSPALFALYSRMRRMERQHSLRVLRALLASGHAQPDLLVAALLHDVGKTRARFSLPEKVLVVLVKACWPERYRRWGAGLARGWRRPFAVSAQHPTWGAKMVAAAGGTPLTVELVHRHATPLDGPPQTDADRLLAALQAVDDRY